MEIKTEKERIAALQMENLALYSDVKKLMRGVFPEHRLREFIGVMNGTHKAVPVEEEKSSDFYKDFYDKNRVPMLQYESLRNHFNKMVKDVLGPDYYNMAMDVYDSDRAVCEDITRKANRKWWSFWG